MTQDFQLPEPASLLPRILPAIEAAGALLRAEFHREGGPRGHGSHAEIDAQVEEFLRRALMAVHPCGWRGEETARGASSHPDTWVVDPQDGTRAFLRGIRGAAISVALARRGRPVLGVVFAPTAPDDRGDLFTWAEGLRMVRNGVPQAPLSRGQLGATSVIALNEEAGDYAAANHARYAPAGIRALPSIAYRLALAAVGEVDVAISLTSGLDSYDIAGGHALLIGAGGELVQLDGAPITHCGTFQGCIGGRPGVTGDVLAREPQGSKREPRPRLTPRRSADPLRLSRAQGALLGLLAGDALGSQVEFQSPARIRGRFPDGLHDLLPGGTWGLVTGQPTDDGEMALALARSLVAERGYVPEKVGAAYVTWGASEPFDIGNTTRAGLAALAGRGRPNGASQANGALMRAAPIGIAAGNPTRAAAWGRKDAALTHPHPLCQAANAAFCAAIAAGIQGASPHDMIEAARVATTEDGDTIRECLRADGPPGDFLTNQGWVLLAFQNAVFHLRTGTRLAEALSWTVAQGGDTDTNAAICGALLGAAQGREALPVLWVSQILGCRTPKVPHILNPRPCDFWPDQTLDLAEALLSL